MSSTTATILTQLDFSAHGKQVGTLRLPYSPDDDAYGFIPILAAVISGGDGPTVLINGGVHGDELEGPLVVELLRYLDLGESIQTSISAPRLRLFNGNKVLIKGGVPAAVTDQLIRLGHDVERGADLTPRDGGLQAVCFDPYTEHFDGGADPRRDGVALIA